MSVTLAQGGLTTAAASPDIASLGTVFYEPVWVFQRGSGSLQPGPGSLTGRVAIGQPGSGTRALADKLLPAIGLDLSRAGVIDMSATEAGAHSCSATCPAGRQPWRHSSWSG